MYPSLPGVEGAGSHRGEPAGSDGTFGGGGVGIVNKEEARKKASKRASLQPQAKLKASGRPVSTPKEGKRILANFRGIVRYHE